MTRFELNYKLYRRTWISNALRKPLVCKAIALAKLEQPEFAAELISIMEDKLCFRAPHCLLTTGKTDPSHPDSMVAL